MKKISLVLSCVCSLLLADVNFSDSGDIDKLAIAGLKSSIQNVDKNSAGLWYLYMVQTKKWEKLRNDEFELQGAIEQAYPSFMKDIEKYQSFIGQSTNILLNVELGEYDFSKESFPIQRLMSPKSHLTFRGSNITGFNDIELSFDNTNPEHTFLPMSKEQAKQFIQKRKSGSGYVNRELTAKYYFKTASIDTPEKPIVGCMSSKGSTNNCYGLTKVKVVGHVQKIEILDDKAQVLTVFNY